MRAMVLPGPGSPLRLEERADPEPGDGEIRVKVSACGVCRTDLHVLDGELPDIKYPIVPGHEIVGRVDLVGADVTTHRVGDRVGIPDILWGERQLLSVANLTRQDGLDFLKVARQAGIRTQTTAFPLEEANDVLAKLRSGQILGAAVPRP